MKVEGYLFLGCAVFFGGSDLVYWQYSHDPTGTTALALSVALAFLTGFYVLFTGRRLPKRPEDDREGDEAHDGKHRKRQKRRRVDAEHIAEQERRGLRGRRRVEMQEQEP